MGNQVAMGGATVLAVLTGLLGFVVTVFWLVVGWRAMRAHEKIAETLREWRSSAS